MVVSVVSPNWATGRCTLTFLHICSAASALPGAPPHSLTSCKLARPHCEGREGHGSMSARLVVYFQLLDANVDYIKIYYGPELNEDARFAGQLAQCRFVATAFCGRKWPWVKTVLVPFWRCTTHFRTYLSGDWDVHCGYDLDLTHGQIPLRGVSHYLAARRLYLHLDRSLARALVRKRISVDRASCRVTCSCARRRHVSLSKRAWQRQIHHADQLRHRSIRVSCPLGGIDTGQLLENPKGGFLLPQSHRWVRSWSCRHGHCTWPRSSCDLEFPTQKNPYRAKDQRRWVSVPFSIQTKELLISLNRHGEAKR